MYGTVSYRHGAAWSFSLRPRGPLCPRGPLRTTRYAYPASKRPAPHTTPSSASFFLFFFFSFFPRLCTSSLFSLLSLSLALPIPFVRLSPSSRSIIIETVSRSHPAAMHTHVCCSGYVWLVIPHDSRPDLTNQRASVSRVKVTLV